MAGSGLTDRRRNQEEAVQFLHQCLKKLLKIRRAWDVLFRVTPPTAPQVPYSIILEKGPLTEQFFLSQQEVARSVSANTDIYLAAEIRTAIQRLEKRARQKSARS